MALVVPLQVGVAVAVNEPGAHKIAVAVTLPFELANVPILFLQSLNMYTLFQP